MKLGLALANFSWPVPVSELGTTITSLARQADDAGFDSLWVMDHFFQISLSGGLPPESPMPEAYATLGVLAGQTRSIRLGTLVTSVAYRHPGVLLKTVTTLDVLSGGRMYLGVGAGAPFNRPPQGAGTRFEIFLPALQSVTTSSTRTHSPFAPPRGHGQRILFVDDDNLAGPAIGRLVGALGYRVTEFSDPREALARFQAAPHNFDLVLTDLAMPGMPGDQFAARVLATRPDIPVALVSGYLEPGRQASLQSAGIRAVLEKPLGMDTLAPALARLLP